MKMKSFLSAVLIMVSLFSYAHTNMKTGIWQGELAMNDRLFIPFQLKVEQDGKKSMLLMIWKKS